MHRPYLIDSDRSENIRLAQQHQRVYTARSFPPLDGCTLHPSGPPGQQAIQLNRQGETMFRQTDRSIRAQRFSH
ncbi:MAG TPA: hypothetical protein VFF70_02335, partial [Anaerolineae bacterium]|nr:hypothetical protein [Anaerolineae bacterium]